jgi:hypothetical protein
MSHLSQTLERLIQIISIEQLVGLIDKNTNNSNSYENNVNNNNNNNTVPNIVIKDYSDDIAKIHEQLATINSSLLSLSEAIKNITIVNTVKNDFKECEKEEEHIRLNIEEKPVFSEGEVVIVSPALSKIESISNAEEIDDEEVEESDAEESEPEVIDAVERDDDEEEVEDSDSEESEPEIIDADEREEVEEEEVEEEEIEKEIEEEEIEEEEIEEVEEVEVENDADESDIIASAEEAEEEVFEIEIDDVTYYATSEENGILYAVEEDGEVGKQVGIIKDGEPIFS